MAQWCRFRSRVSVRKPENNCLTRRCIRRAARREFRFGQSGIHAPLAAERQNRYPDEANKQTPLRRSRPWMTLWPKPNRDAPLVGCSAVLGSYFQIFAQILGSEICTIGPHQRVKLRMDTETFEHFQVAQRFKKWVRSVLRTNRFHQQCRRETSTVRRTLKRARLR